MTHLEALDTLAGHPHVENYRRLTADDCHDPMVRDAWRAKLIRRATGQPEPVQGGVMGEGSGASGSINLAPQTLVVSPPDPWLPLIRACEHHNPGCCVHPAAYCTRFGRDTTREQCIACLTADGIVPLTTDH